MTLILVLLQQIWQKQKILFNSVISDVKNGAWFCSMDLKDMFLHTPMLSPEYMRVAYKYFPNDIRQRYNLNNIVHTDGYIYIKIKKGMYGLWTKQWKQMNYRRHHLRKDKLLRAIFSNRKETMRNRLREKIRNQRNDIFCSQKRHQMKRKQVLQEKT